MNLKQSRISGLRAGIIASVILAVLNLIIIGATFQRRSAANQLQVSFQILEENYAELEKINLEQLAAHREEYIQIYDEVLELEASFPELGIPFALFQQAFGLSNKSNVDLRSISRSGSDPQEEVSGSILINNYDIELSGTPVDCIGFIEEIETAGRDTIVIHYASFWPEEYLCSLEITTLGIPTATED